MAQQKCQPQNQSGALQVERACQQCAVIALIHQPPPQQQQVQQVQNWWASQRNLVLEGWPSADCAAVQRVAEVGAGGVRLVATPVEGEVES